MGRNKRRRISGSSKQLDVSYVESENQTPADYSHSKPEIVELIGKYLDQEDVLICRQVCRLWKEYIGNGVDCAEAVLQVKELLSLSPVKIAKVLPHLQCLKLRMSGRARADNFQLFCEMAAAMKLLKELHLLLCLPDLPLSQTSFDMDLAGLANLTQLQALTISGRWALSCPNLTWLRELPALTRLCLQPQLQPLGPPQHRHEWHTPLTPKFGITADSLQVLASMTKLQHLDTWLDMQAEPQVTQLSALTKLTHLALHNVYLGLLSLEAVARLPHLRCLSAGLAPDSDAAPLPLDCRDLMRATQLDSLKLHLRGRDLADRSFRGISKLRALDELHLDACSGWDDAGDVLQQLTKLTSLEVSNSSTSVAAPWEAVRELRGLRQLVLHNFSAVASAPRSGRSSTPRKPGYLWRDMQQLRLLSVTGHMHRDLVDRSSVAYALWNAPQLSSLHFDFPAALEHGLEVASLSQHLTSLHLGHCWAVCRQSSGLRARLAGLRAVTLDSVCLLVLPAGVAPKALDSPRDSRALRDALMQQLRDSPALVEVKRSPQVGQLLELLPAELRELRLLAVQQLADRDFAAVARFTRLQQLAIHSISNPQVSHASLRLLVGLRQLLALVWEVGDMFELIPHPPTLAQLRQLHVLGLTWSLYHSMSRFNALCILEDRLQSCQLSVK